MGQGYGGKTVSAQTRWEKKVEKTEKKKGNRNRTDGKITIVPTDL